MIWKPIIRPAVCMAFLAWCLAGSRAHAQEPVPLDHFTRSDELGTMKISPDGEFLAATMGEHGGEYLAFMRVGERKAVGAIKARDGMVIHEFYWAPPTRVVFTIAERNPGFVAPSLTGEIFAVNRDGSRQELIYGYRAGEMSTGTIMRVREASYASAEIVSLLDDDDRNILIAETPWKQSGGWWRYDPDAKPTILKLDIFTGKQSRVDHVPLSGADVLVDRQDQPRFAIGRDAGGKLSVAWKQTATADWEEFELPGFRDTSVRPRRFTADDKSVLFTGVKEAERYSALYRLDLADRAVTKLIDLPGADVRGLLTDLQDEQAVGVWGYAEKRVHRWLTPDHPSARLQEALHRAFAGNEVTFINHSADGRRAIVFVRSDVAPGEYLLFDTQTKRADMLATARSWIDLRKMRPKEPITLGARDGLPLHGYLTQPAAEGPYPTIVMPHGGPHGIRDVWTFDWEAQLLASRGYAVLQVNFRGSGGYGMDFEQAGYGEWGAGMQDDLTDATRWAVDQNIASPDRICIFGASYGGYAALMGAAREPELYRCAIGYAGVYDLELMYESGDIPESNAGLAYLLRVLGDDIAKLRSRSPVHLADKIEIPVLLIHGKEDWRADYAQATRMKAALEAAQKPLEWLALRGEGHGVYDDRTRLEVYEGILKFLDTHLGAGSSAGL